MTRVRIAALSLATAIAMTLLAATPHAHANGVPTIVQLSYLAGLSNWGPVEASGTLELALGEGYAKVSAAGMQQLSGKRYQGWLVASQTNNAVSIGTFAANASGVVSYRGALPNVPNFGFDLFIITVEPEPDDAPTPSSERSIGGRFSLIGQRGPDGSGGDPAAAGAAPKQLPNTGDSTLRSDLVRVGVLVGALGACTVVAMRLGRRHA